MNSIKSFLFILFLAAPFCAKAQTVYVDINPDVKRVIGEIETFNRKKFVTIHADMGTSEWNQDNEIADLRSSFMNGYDVYGGRNTGTITWNINNNIDQDPSRSGFANPSSIAYYGKKNIQSYASDLGWHAFEERNDQILCAQLHPFYPDGQKTKKGWAFSQTNTDVEPFGTATGEYMGRFIQDFYGQGGTSGQPQPAYLEIINEPLWHLVDYGSHQPEEVFRFHNGVAKEVRKYAPDIQIGGYCTAFPDFDKNDFKQWEERWKLFMDISGEQMDYWTIHLYDFPSIGGGKQKYRKGSNMEATFDMMEQYSYLKFGKVKPIMVSEYGAQMHDYFGAWSEYRDWLHLKSVNSMMMQFMERPNIINKTLNFLIVKAEWGTTSVNDTYNHRLMRRKNEPVSLDGKWVYTDMVKTYQLWSDVNGTRTDSYSSNIDVLTDTYVDGNKVYVIINNLDFESKPIKVVGSKLSNNPLQQTKIKHLYLKGSSATLDESTLAKGVTDYTLAPEGTIIIEYTYQNNIVFNDNSTEKKYYANTYFKPIIANQTETFQLNGIEKGEQGEATLRVGVGRDHGKSLKPDILFNGTALEIPDNFRGGPQTDRDNYFGVLEIPVPYPLLNENNTVQVKFSDNGGHLSTVTMRVFNHSRKIERTGEKVVEISLNPEEKISKPGKTFTINATVVPETALNNKLRWISSNQIVAGVDTNGVVETRSLGTSVITAITKDNSVWAYCTVTVSNDAPPVIATALHIKPENLIIKNPGTLQLLAELTPTDVDDTTLVWTSDNEEIATIDQNGLVTAVSKGTVNITGTTKDGSELSKTVSISVPKFTSSATCSEINEVYKQANRLSFKVPYSVSETKDLLVFISELNGFNALAEGRLTVDKGTDTATVHVDMDEMLPTGEYSVWVRVTKVGGSWTIATSTCSTNITIEKSNAVNNMELAKIKLYPNPTKNGWMKIIIPEHLSGADLKIFNAAGKLVGSTQKMATPEHSIQLPNPGVYIFQFNSAHATFSKKVVFVK